LNYIFQLAVDDRQLGAVGAGAREDGVTKLLVPAFSHSCLEQVAAGPVGAQEPW
jgi:hypothetical protein